MADVHECEECGMQCDCDGEDMCNPQPDDCVHFDEHCVEDLEGGDDGEVDYDPDVETEVPTPLHSHALLSAKN